MRVSISMSGTSKFEKELLRIESQLSRPFEVKREVEKATQDLRVATPVDSGETASKWGNTITKTARGMDISITNSSTTKDGIPIPILLRDGHGTGTGGYVAPNDFITPISDALVKNVSSSLERKLK